MKLKPIPDSLLEASAAAKYVYLCLAGQGEVSLSSRELAEGLGLSQPTVRAAISMLEDAGVLTFCTKPQERIKPTFKVLSCDEVLYSKP